MNGDHTPGHGSRFPSNDFMPAGISSLKAVFDMDCRTRREMERFYRRKTRPEGRHNMGGYRDGFSTDSITRQGMTAFLRGGRLA